MQEMNFFTIGYEGLGINRFLEILKANDVKTLLDSRHNSFSANLDFRQKKLTLHLEKHWINYAHLKGFGIPNESRKACKPIEWYVQNVMPKIDASIIRPFEQPACFMCMEKDVNSCHRKIILDTLRDQGLEGKDLYPNKGEL